MYKDFDKMRDLLILILILWVGFINVNTHMLTERAKVVTESNRKLHNIVTLIIESEKTVEDYQNMLEKSLAKILNERD